MHTTHVGQMALKLGILGLQLQKKTSSPARQGTGASFPPSAPTSFNGHHLYKGAEELRGQMQHEWTPEDVLMVAGKTHLLPMLPASMYNIAKVALGPAECHINGLIQILNPIRATCFDSPEQALPPSSTQLNDAPL